MAYFFEKAISNFRQGLGGNLLALATIAAALLVFLAYLLTARNLDANLDRWRSRMNIAVYLYDEGAQHSDNVAELRQMLESLEGVASVHFVPKDEALRQYRADLKGQASLLDLLEENPLPAYFVVSLTSGYQTPERVKQAARTLESWEEVEEVSYGEEWLTTVEGVVALVRLGSFLLGGILLLAILFIVFNTIRLALFSRKEEIEIMQLVGATPLFIKIPYLIEGALQTLLSGAVALAGLYALHIGYVSARLDLLVQGFGDFTWSFLDASDGLAILGGSFLVGLIGSWIAVERFLRRR